MDTMFPATSRTVPLNHVRHHLACMADIADDLMAILSDSAVGLIKRVDGVGSEVLGSGVLVSLDRRRGLLTAGHVAETYKDKDEIGLIRFAAGNQLRPSAVGRDPDDHRGD